LRLNTALDAMKDIGSPVVLAQQLIALFPPFEAELANDQIENYHQVIQRLAPVLAGYLESGGEKTVKRFCDLVNLMADAGGDKENAIATCLLEHASQIKVAKVLRPHLNAAAKQELR
jgi:hypothetical protein